MKMEKHIQNDPSVLIKLLQVEKKQDHTGQDFYPQSTFITGL